MSEKIEIPGQLKKEEFRFLPLEGKKPLLPKWVEFNYPYNHPAIQSHIKAGKNYGVVCGYGNLVVIDVDYPKNEEKIKNFEEVVRKLESELPATFTVKSGGGGLHFYYVTTREIQSTNIEIDGIHIDIQSKGKQVVGANCIHPTTKKRYEIVKNVDIAKINVFDLYLFFTPLLRTENKQLNQPKTYLNNLLNLILKKLKCKDKGKYYVCNCPFHKPDNHPSFAIYKNSHLAVDFHDNHIYLLKELAEKLNLKEITEKELEKENENSIKARKDIEIKKTISQEEFEKEERKGELKLKINLSDENFITKYVQIFSQRTDAPIDYHYCCAISVISSLINRKIKCSLAQETIYPNCWLFLVGDPTTARKSVATRFAENLLRDVGYNSFLPTDFTPESLIEFLADTPRCLFLFDEGAGFLTRLNKKTYNADLKYVLCRLYDNTDYRRKLRTRRGENTDFRVESPYLNQLIGIQPQSLARHSNEEDFESGFCLRFLYSYPTYPRKLRALSLLTEKDKENYRYLVEEAKKIKEFIDEIEEEEEIKWKEGAFTYFIKWSTALQEESLKTKNPDFKNAIGRLIIYAIKLAMVFAVAEKEKTIDINIIKESCRIITSYFLPMHLRVYNLIKYDINKNLQERIINFLERNGGSATYRTVAQYLHCRYTDLLDSIDYLQNISKEIEVVEVASGNKKKKIIRLISDNSKYNNLLKSVEKGVSTKIPKNSAENRRILANHDSVELLKSVEMCADKEEEKERIKYSTNFNNSTTTTNSPLFSAETTSKPQNSPLSDSATKFNKLQQTPPLSKRVFDISLEIIKDYIKKHPESYQKNGVPVKYFCDSLNEQISLLQQCGIIKKWCKYARDYLLSLSESGKIRLKDKGIFIEKGEENE